MLTIRSSAALVLAASLAAAPGGAAQRAVASERSSEERGNATEVRRAAALLDYVARGYGAAVVQGRVVNEAEYAEQRAFTQEAAELLERLPVGRPFAAEARALEQQIAARAPAESVAARASSIDRRLLDAAGLATTPPPALQASLGAIFYAESCAACHGKAGRGDGFAASSLATRPLDFTGPDRAQLTPYRVYSAITWGVPRTAMPAFDSLSEQRRWLIALETLTFGHSEEDARRGEELARRRGLRGPPLVAQSDAELQAELTRSGFADDEVRALLAWVRRIAPFAGPPPAGFPEQRTHVSLAAISYVHGRLEEAQARLDGARAEWTLLRPLVRAAAPEKIGPVQDGFAEVRRQMSAPGAAQRVLGSTAQLARALAEAGPESLPTPETLRRAGAWGAAEACGAAALALLAALLATSAAAPRLFALPALAALGGAAAGLALATRPGLVEALPHAPDAVAAIQNLSRLAARDVAVLLSLAVACWKRWRAPTVAAAALASFVAASAAALNAGCRVEAITLLLTDAGPPLSRGAIATAAAFFLAAGAAAAALRRRELLSRIAAAGALVASVLLSWLQV